MISPKARHRKTHEDGITLLDNSRRWAVSLDRSFLGLMAIDVDLLGAMKARVTMEIETERKDSDGWHYVDKKLRKAIYMAGDETARMNDFYAEVYFWMLLENVQRDIEHIEYERRFNSQTNARIGVLFSAKKHPEYVTYYEAGIWDEAFIIRCLAEGIDASMALELTGSAT